MKRLSGFMLILFGAVLAAGLLFLHTRPSRPPGDIDVTDESMVLTDLADIVSMWPTVTFLPVAVLIGLGLLFLRPRREHNQR